MLLTFQMMNLRNPRFAPGEHKRSSKVIPLSKMMEGKLAIMGDFTRTLYSNVQTSIKARLKVRYLEDLVPRYMVSRVRLGLLCTSERRCTSRNGHPWDGTGEEGI